MLVGMVVKNAIVLIDYINLIREVYLLRLLCAGDTKTETMLIDH